MTSNTVTVSLTAQKWLKQTLQEASVENPASVRNLTISGTLTASDFWYIRKNMGTTLHELDIANASDGYRLPDEAFKNCTGLTSVILPNTLKKFETGVFWGCESLISITIHPDNANFSSENGVLFNKDKTELIFFPQGRKGEYVIPESVVKIGEAAFCGCYGLTSIIIPDTVVKINREAFSYCTGLTSIIIPNSVTEIDDSVFYKCEGLTSVVIPNSVMKIGVCAFSGCSDLTSITIPDSVTEIGYGAFYECISLTSITIPNSVTEIGEGTFYNCTDLTSVVFPDFINEIGEDAFFGCTGLSAINISSVHKIRSGAFYGCTGLISVKIHNSDVKIESDAFEDCDVSIKVYPIPTLPFIWD